MKIQKITLSEINDKDKYVIIDSLRTIHINVQYKYSYRVDETHDAMAFKNQFSQLIHIDIQDDDPNAKHIQIFKMPL